MESFMDGVVWIYMDQRGFTWIYEMYPRIYISDYPSVLIDDTAVSFFP